MPPTTDPLPDPSPGADDESARWEQALRDARPRLPEAAIGRIEAAMQCEIEAREGQWRGERPTARRAAATSPMGKGFWILAALALFIGAAAGVFILWRLDVRKAISTTQPSAPSPIVQESIPLDVPIEDPSAVSTASARPTALIEADTKTIQDDGVKYQGHVRVAAGPWRIGCAKLALFQSGGSPSLLSGTGHVIVTGIAGLSAAAADEFTLNVPNDELKLSGHVSLEGDARYAGMLKSCTISRQGHVVETKK